MKQIPATPSTSPPVPASEGPASPVNRGDPKDPLDIGTLSEQEREELFRRCALLGDLAERERVSNAKLSRRAQEVGLSARTLRRYHTRFRLYGMIGLAPRARTDRGKLHNISPHMTQVVESLRLTHRDAPVRHVYELACQYASATGELPPSLHQVRSICAQIPELVRLLADGREGEFRNRFRLTYPIHHDPHRIVWQIDHKDPLHVMVRDIRAPSHQRPSGEVRPVLTMVVDSASRLVMTGLFSYDEPNRFTVAAAIRDAMLTNEHKPFGGIPDEIWIDNGKDLVAHHVYQLAEGLGIKLVAGPPHDPEIRGIVERLHRTLDTRLWSTLPGYVGPNVVERNPRAKAELTISQLNEHFRAFIDRYHHEVHSETGQTPLDFWERNATPIPLDKPLLRLLDVLLKEPATRRVHKDGIKYAAERYWHPELSVLVGEDVLVRVAPHYTAPDEIEVFFEGKWRCTAFAFSSPQGQTLERQVIVEAQRRQRAHARGRIKAARDIYKMHQVSLPTSSQASSASKRPGDRHRRQPAYALDTLATLDGVDAANMPPAPAATATHQPDLFDFLVAQQSQQDNQNNGSTPSNQSNPKGETR